MPVALAATPAPTTIGLPLGNEADPYSPAVARLGRSIVMYTRWPDDPATLRACVIGPTDHGDDLLAGKSVASVGVSAVAVTVAAAQPGACDIVYIGRMSLEEQRVVTARMRGAPVLTIAENDPACRSRAMFCLLYEAESLSFRLNIDAVASSQIRIDPRVLRMGAGGAP